MQYKLMKQRAAFSMVELIFAIMVLGIVSSIGAEIIAQVYEGYVTQRASHRSSTKTELAATQLANRLSYAIPDTIIGRNATSSTFEPISDMTTNNYDTLEWIAYDADGFSAFRRPAWSGFADLNPSTATTISTPGSQLANADTIIKNLSKGKDKALAGSALFFPGRHTAATVGYNGNATGVVRVTGGAGETLSVENMTNTLPINEQYKLAWSAYAIVMKSNGKGTFDLNLHYNYQPWNGQSYTTGKVTPLLRNVSVFKFTGSANTLRFKICQQENVGGSFMITTCKEKAVIR